MTQSERDPEGLSPDMMADNPMQQFAGWMAEAAQVLPEPTAMVLTTTSAQGRPRARTVLLKAHGPEGFTFYTNRTSRKGQDLAASPRACVVFPWYALGRQVTAEGPVAMMSQADSAPYFRSRPRGSQISAWASRQSTAIGSRKELDDRVAELEARWPEGMAVPMPDFWRGYVLEPETVEFWQSGQYRLHDRLRYRRDGAAWTIERLSPLFSGGYTPTPQTPRPAGLLAVDSPGRETLRASAAGRPRGSLCLPRCCSRWRPARLALLARGAPFPPVTGLPHSITGGG